LVGLFNFIGGRRRKNAQQRIIFLHSELSSLKHIDAASVVFAKDTIGSPFFEGLPLVKRCKEMQRDD
jgi:hypothetical protein